MQALNIHWQQGHARGSMVQSKGVVQSAQELGIEPKSAVIGGFDLGDETIMHETYRYWNALIQKGLQHDSLTGGKNDK